MGTYYIKKVYMLKMEYFNVRLLVGMLRSKQVSGRLYQHSVYSVNVRVASNCLKETSGS